MHFLFNTGYYKPTTHTGGPIYSVSALAEALVERGHRVTVAAIRNLEDPINCELDQNYVLNGVTVRLFDPTPYWWQKLPISRLRDMSVSRLDDSWIPWLREIMPSVDVCDSQLGFLYSNRAVSRMAHQLGKIHLYHQRGNLDPRRFGANSRFKRVYLNLIEQPILQSAGALIALSQREAEVYRLYAPNSRIEVVPNGVDLNEWQQPAAAEGDLADTFALIGDAPLVVWHSRMAKMKGPDVFVRAFALAHEKEPSIQAIVAGPDEEGIRGACEQMAQESGVAKSVHFLDALSGANRRALLQRADLFVLPTAGEGLSMAILEALACRCPVVTTPEANISEIQRHGAGLIVPCDDQRIGDAMLDVLSRAPGSLADMGASASALVEAEFSMKSVVDRYIVLAEEIVYPKYGEES
jgi:glycosyltransferase involved in cell wall biosynthesis